MEYENLWTFPSVNTPFNSTENVFKIMQSQERYLNEGMGGSVQASFHAMSPEIRREELTDANEFYQSSKYVFDIYNNSYCYRVFSMYLSSLYPAEVILDTDLMKSVRHYDLEIEERYIDEGEYEYEECVIIRSDEALMNLLKKIFSTRKVQFMLYRLRQMSEEAKKGA